MPYLLELLLIYHSDGSVAKSMLLHKITLVMTITPVDLGMTMSLGRSVHPFVVQTEVSEQLMD